MRRSEELLLLVRVVGLGLAAVVAGGLAGAADDDLVGLDADAEFALAGPVLFVDRVLLDRGIEPEAVAVLVAVVEGRLDLFAATTPTAAAAATSATATGSSALAALGALLV